VKRATCQREIVTASGPAGTRSEFCQARDGGTCWRRVLLQNGGGGMVQDENCSTPSARPPHTCNKGGESPEARKRCSNAQDFSDEIARRWRSS